MTKVIVEPDESFESALKRFKKQCEKPGSSQSSRSASTMKSPAFGVSAKALAARKKAKRRERVSD